METETIASRNVVSLLLGDLYNAAICKVDPDTVDEKAEAANESYVYGWDC